MTTSDLLPENNQTPANQLNYEQAFAELEEVVAALESEEHSLDEALALFERGQLLIRHCSDMLEKADLKVQQLSGEGLVDFDPET